MDVDRVLEKPAIVHANHFRFAPGEVVGPRTVASRMVLWTISGSGELVVDGVRHSLDKDHVFVVPWKRVSKIVSSIDRPLHVGGAHVVPWLDNEDPVVWSAAHDRDDPLFGSPTRGDVTWGSPSGSTIAVSGPAARDIVALGEMSIQLLGEGNLSLPVMRSLAIVMVSRLVSPPDQIVRPIPRTLRAAQDYCLTHLNSSISTRDLAMMVGISDSALARQFVTYVGSPPQTWLRERRLEHAARLLQTSTLRVGEVARAVGFVDPLHFSRAFSARFGISPREFSKSSPRL